MKKKSTFGTSCRPDFTSLYILFGIYLFFCIDSFAKSKKNSRHGGGRVVKDEEKNAEAREGREEGGERKQMNNRLNQS